MLRVQNTGQKGPVVRDQIETSLSVPVDELHCSTCTLQSILYAEQRKGRVVIDTIGIRHGATPT